MITYDGVSVPGYEIASKRGMATTGVEGMELLMEDEDLRVLSTAVIEDNESLDDTIGYESIKCQEVLDILGSDEVTVTYESTAIGIVNLKKGSIQTNLRKRSVFHEMAKGAL